MWWKGASFRLLSEQRGNTWTGICSSCGRSFEAPGATGFSYVGRRSRALGQPWPQDSEVGCETASGRFSTGAREARDDGGTNGPGTTGATHAVQRAGRRAVGLLESGANPGFRGAIQCGKDVAKMRPGPPIIPAPPPVPAQVPRILPPPPRVPAQVHL